MHICPLLSSLSPFLLPSPHTRLHPSRLLLSPAEERSEDPRSQIDQRRRALRTEVNAGRPNDGGKNKKPHCSHLVPGLLAPFSPKRDPPSSPHPPLPSLLVVRPPPSAVFIAFFRCPNRSACTAAAREITLAWAEARCRHRAASETWGFEIKICKGREGEWQGGKGGGGGTRWWYGGNQGLFDDVLGRSWHTLGVCRLVD